MGHGQIPPLEGGNLSPEKPEDKLATKANDSLHGDVSKQGFEGLNSQLSQQNLQDKVDRNLTLDQQMQKNGKVKMGIITRDFNCSVEISGTDPKTGKTVEYLRGRTPDEVARAKEAEAKTPQQKRDQEQAYKDKFGEDAGKPVGTTTSGQLTDTQLDQSADFLAKRPAQEKPIPVLVAYGNDSRSDAAPTPGQVYKTVQPQEVPVRIAQGFKFPNPVDGYKKEIEHHYRGRELETMSKEIPAKAWYEAYKAFPELKQLGEKDSTRLMKAIIANELDHYGTDDLAEDAIAKSGHSSILHNKTIGFPQIKPDAIKEQAHEWDEEVAEGTRATNPLKRFESMTTDQLANELENPANAPLFVASNLAHNLKMLNHHKSEVHVTPESLGYEYNPDCVYAKSDTKHQQSMSRKEAADKGIPYNSALPTHEVLKKSEHAANIRKWLAKVE